MIVVPALKPLTTPVVPTVAAVVFDEDHEPPDVVLPRVVVFPVQTVAVPVNALTSGSGFTVMIFVA